MPPIPGASNELMSFLTSMLTRLDNTEKLTDQVKALEAKNSRLQAELAETRKRLEQATTSQTSLPLGNSPNVSTSDHTPNPSSQEPGLEASTWAAKASVNRPPPARKGPSPRRVAASQRIFTAASGPLGYKYVYIPRSRRLPTGKYPPSPPSKWKKFWTPALQAAADHRDGCYKQWRRACGIDKINWWSRHQHAHQEFRQQVQTAKRQSWHAFCRSLERDFAKATSKIKQIKRRRQPKHVFQHDDGPAAAATIMCNHLASVYSGHILPSSRPPPPPSTSPHLPFAAVTPHLIRQWWKNT
ncbi:hypothetical protein CLU79DRAFT_723522 [Phycomyces nitens]|nr:hypothetical protein CLU79DRAFT_723522 [Phycomyces nitens]